MASWMIHALAELHKCQNCYSAVFETEDTPLYNTMRLCVNSFPGAGQWGIRFSGDFHYDAICGFDNQRNRGLSSGQTTVKSGGAVIAE